MKKPFKALTLASTVLAASIAATTASAAIIPAGTQLADVQELVRGNGAEPASLDPQKVEGSPGNKVVKDLFEGLINQDAEGNVIPGQAESWTISEDNREFIFKIRKDAKWSNGDPVTAHDFVYGFQRAVDPATASRYSWYMEVPTIINASEIVAGKKPVDTLGVKALDDHTFQVNLEKPVPYFIKMLAHYTMFPAPQKVIKEHGDNWTRAENMVSNGAYKLSSWTVNESIVLERNAQYWNNDETVINKVTFLPISGNTELSRYKAGEVDVTNGINPIPLQHFSKLQKEIPAEIKITPRLSTYYYEFNMDEKPFDDVRVRKALSYAINRDAIAKYVMKQGHTPAYTFTPNSVAGFVPPATEYSQMTQKERDQKARELLEDAGFNKNNPLKVSLLYNTDEAHKQIAIAVSQMWKPLGVQVTLENQEWKTFLDTKNQGDYQVARAGWAGDYNEASTFLDLMTSGHGQNDANFASPEYDALMQKSRVVTSDEERSALYKRAEEILADEVPLAPVVQYVTSRLVKTYVGGYPMKNVEDNVYTRDLYIIKQ